MCLLTLVNMGIPSIYGHRTLGFSNEKYAPDVGLEPTTLGLLELGG